MRKAILDLSMFVKLRYMFYTEDEPHPELILLGTGLDPIRYYMIRHDLSSQAEYDERVIQMEPLPGFFIEGDDASKLARSILAQLELPEEEAEEVFTQNSLFEVKEFYSILNNLIDKLWLIRTKVSTLKSLT